MFHSILERQLRKTGLSLESLPESLRVWHLFLEKINSAYVQNDADLYLLQRSLEISSKEMMDRWVELQKINLRKEVIFNSAFDSIIITDEKGIITEVNLTAMNTFDWSENSAIGKHIQDFISYENRELSLTDLFAISENDKKQFFQSEMIGRRLAKRETFPVQTYCTSIEFKHNVIYLWYLRDLTRQKAYETIIDKQQLNLAAASKFATLGEMAGGIAHEINTPLATMKVIIEIVRKFLLEKPPSIEVILEKLDLLETTIDRIASIIRNLRNFSRSGSGDPFREENLKDLLSETLSLCAEKLKKHQIHLIVQEFQEDLKVLCRGTQIGQVILNLLNNSFDAIENLPEKWIRIDICSKANLIQISITDSGPGIPPQIAQQLFQPFFTTKEASKGTGLGLGISRKIIDEHHGKIFYDPKSINTRFVIELPKNNPLTK